MTKQRTKRRRCGARLKQNIEVHPETGRIRSKGGRCRAWAMKGKTRCRMHGGMSTGPKTDEGMARTVGKKVPGGRKSGDAWFTPAMCARAAIESR